MTAPAHSLSDVKDLTASRKLANIVSKYTSLTPLEIDPFHQFYRINLIYDWLTSDDFAVSSTHKVIEIFIRKLRLNERPELISEYVMNLLQITMFLRRKGIDDFKNQFFEIDQRVRSADSWIEKAYSSSDEVSALRNTFFLPYVIQGTPDDMIFRNIGSQSALPR